MAGLVPLGSQPSVSSNSSYNSSENRYRRQRKAHHKVKTGCKACKVRRHKCDERKPTCSGCSRHSTKCVYPSQERPRLGSRTSFGSKSAAGVLLYSSPSKTLPICPPPELNLGDLELMHQYLTSTCMATAQKPEITAHIQAVIPRLAQSYPFVMRGILAMAATHLSRLRPSHQAHYAMVAARNHNAAIPEYRSALQNINEENCHALISYAKSLLWCTFAGYDPSNEAPCPPAAVGTWLPGWFYLLRGSCHVVEFSRPWIKDGPHVRPILDGTFDFSNSPHDGQILSLMSRLVPVTESSLCKTVLLNLRESFALAYMQHHNTPARNAINHWIGLLPEEFTDLLQKKEPWTLVVLAYFCILIHRSEAVWFMKGHSTNLMRLIIEGLGITWRHYIQWPCQELGIEKEELSLEA